MRMDPRRVALVLVALHYLVNFGHGFAHLGAPVPLTAAQIAFVTLVIGLGPLGALWLLRSGRATLAWATLAVVFLASFGFGVAFHYLIASPDHVANVPAGFWHLPFGATAFLAAVVDGGGAVIAGWYTRQAQRVGPTDSIDDTT